MNRDDLEEVKARAWEVGLVSTEKCVEREQGEERKHRGHVDIDDAIAFDDAPGRC